MSGPDPTQVIAAVGATWPPARLERAGPWTLREGLGGGSRVSAATLDGSFDESAIDLAERGMAAMRQAPLFMIRDSDRDFDAALAARGYELFDPVTLYTAPPDLLIDTALRPLDAVASPVCLGIQADIWAAGGIGPARLAVMERACAPKTYLLGRKDDRAAGAGFAAIHGDMAMVHALETLARFRRRGVARAMLSRAARWAKSEGAGHIALAVTEGNTAANALYQALGMTRAGGYHYRRMTGKQPR